MTEPQPVASPLARIIGPVLSVVAVLALVGALLVFRHHPSQPSATVNPAPVGAVTTPSHRASRPVSRSPKPTPTHHPSSPSHSPKPTATPTTPTSTAPATVVKYAVTVLNNSRVYRLAAHVAAELEAKAWPVTETGNYTGADLPATTLFYGAGQYDSAKLLAAEFPEISSLQPRPSGWSGTGLTLVITRYWES